MGDLTNDLKHLMLAAQPEYVLNKNHCGEPATPTPQSNAPTLQSSRVAGKITVHAAHCCCLARFFIHTSCVPAHAATGTAKEGCRQDFLTLAMYANKRKTASLWHGRWNLPDCYMSNEQPKRRIPNQIKRPNSKTSLPSTSHVCMCCFDSIPRRPPPT